MWRIYVKQQWRENPWSVPSLKNLTVNLSCSGGWNREAHWIKAVVTGRRMDLVAKLKLRREGVGEMPGVSFPEGKGHDKQ